MVEFENGIQGLAEAEAYARKKLAEPKIPSMANFNHIKFQKALYDAVVENSAEVDKHSENAYLVAMYAAKRDAILSVLTAFQGAFKS